MAIDEPNGEALSGPLAHSGWGSAPLVPPPPTGPPAPPAPPPLLPEVTENGDNAQQGAHRQMPPAAESPTYPSSRLPEGLRLELVELFSLSGGRLHEAFDQYRGGVTSPSAVVAAGAAMNEALAGDLMLRIRTILGEPWTSAPERARPVAGTARLLMKSPGLTGEAREYLSGVRTSMLDLAESESAQQKEQALLDANSAVLERELRTAEGVFVYTYPHYWRHPYLADLNRRLFRLGHTGNGTWREVLDRARSAGAPEDPVLLRVYPSADPAAAEQTFRRLLSSADHAHALTNNASREWFATTLEFLD
jgi:hypothetical protein